MYVLQVQQFATATSTLPIANNQLCMLRKVPHGRQDAQESTTVAAPDAESSSSRSRAVAPPLSGKSPACWIAHPQTMQHAEQSKTTCPLVLAHLCKLRGPIMQLTGGAAAARRKAVAPYLRECLLSRHICSDGQQHSYTSSVRW